MIITTLFREKCYYYDSSSDRKVDFGSDRALLEASDEHLLFLVTKKDVKNVVKARRIADYQSGLKYRHAQVKYFLNPLRQNDA